MRTKHQAQLLARRFKYRAPRYQTTDKLMRASISDTGRSIEVRAEGYASDMNRLLKWSRKHLPDRHVFSLTKLGHEHRVITGWIKYSTDRKQT